MLELQIRRTKIFQHNDDINQRILAKLGVDRYPDWVTETLTYKYGIADGSIVNLTQLAAELDDRPEAELLGAEEGETN